MTREARLIYDGSWSVAFGAFMSATTDQLKTAARLLFACWVHHKIPLVQLAAYTGLLALMATSVVLPIPYYRETCARSKALFTELARERIGRS